LYYLLNNITVKALVFTSSIYRLLLLPERYVIYH